MDVAAACGIGSGIIVAVNVEGIGDSCGSTIVAVGGIGIGVGAQELRKNQKIRRSDVRFI